MSYKITERIRTSFVVDSERAVSGYRVYFRMDDGTLDYVQIKKSQYSAEAVKTAILEAIAVHDHVLSL